MADDFTNEPIALEFEVSLEDMVQATLAARWRSPEVRFNAAYWKFGKMAFYVVSVLLAFAAGADFSRRETLVNLSALICILVVVVIGGLKWMNKSRGPENSARGLRWYREDYSQLAGHWRVSLTPEELVYQTNLVLYHLPWKVIQNVEETTDWIFLYFIHRPLSIPKRAFADETAVRSFLETVKAYRSA